MAIKKVAKRTTAKKKAVAKGITVKVTAFNSKEMTVNLKVGTPLSKVIADNLPPTWDGSALSASVNGTVRPAEYLLNDGDVIQLVPNVSGGTL